MNISKQLELLRNLTNNLDMIIFQINDLDSRVDLKLGSFTKLIDFEIQIDLQKQQFKQTLNQIQDIINELNQEIK